MLDILQQDLALDPATIGVEVENLAFMTFIERGYEAKDTDAYENSNYFARARGLGEALSSGERTSVMLMKNLSGTHWVSMVLDFANSRILYGDSFGDKVPAKLIAAVEWWTQHHTGRKFTQGALSITFQKDTYSCGILSFNALAHHADQERYPLVKSDRAREARLEILLDIIDRHHSFAVSDTTQRLQHGADHVIYTSNLLKVSARTFSSHSQAPQLSHSPYHVPLYIPEVLGGKWWMMSCLGLHRNCSILHCQNPMTLMARTRHTSQILMMRKAQLPRHLPLNHLDLIEHHHRCVSLLTWQRLNLQALNVPAA